MELPNIYEKSVFSDSTWQYVLLASELFGKTVTIMANKDPEFITFQA